MQMNHILWSKMCCLIVAIDDIIVKFNHFSKKKRGEISEHFFIYCATKTEYMYNVENYTHVLCGKHTVSRLRRPLFIFLLRTPRKPFLIALLLNEHKKDRTKYIVASDANTH